MVDVPLPGHAPPLTWRPVSQARWRWAGALLLALVLLIAISCSGVITESLRCQLKGGAFNAGFNYGFEVARCECKRLLGRMLNGCRFAQ
jgi:hypothetical protein